MNHEHSVSKSIDINASPSKVWKGLTDPAIIKDYLFGTDTVTDWKVGNEVIFQGEYKEKQYKDGGIVRKNIPEKVLSYTYWSGFSGLENKPENHSIITYELERIDDNNTKFTWTQKGFADQERHEHEENGMGEFMETIKSVIEKS